MELDKTGTNVSIKESSDIDSNQMKDKTSEGIFITVRSGKFSRQS